jgi:hypothetical protein
VTDTLASHPDDAVADMALVARDGTSTTEAFEHAAQCVWQAAARTTPDVSSQAIRSMLPLLSVTSAARAGFLGLRRAVLGWPGRAWR